ncbi:MAG: MFS transporter [Chlamydiales bacterium]
MKQPKQLYILAFVQMWNFFSHYGNRALLLLFMVEGLRVTDFHALGIFALYAGLFELGGVFGGMVADRFLGMRRALLLGATLMAAGHLLFEYAFFCGLTLLVVGNALFSPNVMALLGRFYSLKDARRERGFSLFYVIMNCGALLATLLCPLLATRCGYQVGFGLAAIGMGIGVVTLFLYARELRVEENNSRAWIGYFGVFGSLGIVYLLLHGEKILLPVLPFVAMLLFFVIARPLKELLYLFGALVAFFGIEEQMSSSFMLFAEKVLLLGFSPALLLTINPMIVLSCGSVVSRYMGKISRFRLVLPFILVGGVFLILGSFSPSFSLLVGTMAMISFAELMVGPYVFSEVSALSTKATTMGLIPLGFSIASFLGGAISKGVAKVGYSPGFIIIGSAALVVALMLIRRKNAPARIHT